MRLAAVVVQMHFHVIYNQILLKWNIIFFEFNSTKFCALEIVCYNFSLTSYKTDKNQILNFCPRVAIEHFSYFQENLPFFLVGIIVVYSFSC